MSHKGHSKPYPVKLIREIPARTRSTYIQNHKGILVQTEEGEGNFRDGLWKLNHFLAVKIEISSNQFSDRSSSWIFHIAGSGTPFSFSDGNWQGNKYLDFYACELWYSNRFFCLSCISFLAAWMHWSSKVLLRILKQVLNNCLQFSPYYFPLYFGLSVLFTFFTFQWCCPAVSVG